MIRWCKTRPEFRSMIEGELSSMGVSRARYYWSAQRSRLLVYVGLDVITLNIHARRKVDDVEAELGRLWRLMGGLEETRLPNPPQPSKRRQRAKKGQQIDIEELISA